MAAFETPTDFKFNRGLIADPEAFARDANAASWLFLCGEEFAEMEGGMSYASVQAAVPESANVVSDPPRVLNADLARQQVAALDQLPRPTLVTCRTGPRSSALVYLYAGLRAGATAGEVLARAEADDAPFTQSDELKAWVAQSLGELLASAAMATRQAACSCGQLHLTAEGDPVRISMCHCLACQRRTGSAFGIQARFPSDRVRVAGRYSDYIRISDEGEERTFHFCPDCGSTVFYALASAPDVVAVPIGAFADPGFPPPKISVFESRRHPWLAMTAEMEHHD